MKTSLDLLDRLTGSRNDNATSPQDHLSHGERVESRMSDESVATPRVGMLGALARIPA
jgi:hypothetical protein